MSAQYILAGNINVTLRTGNRPSTISGEHMAEDISVSFTFNRFDDLVGSIRGVGSGLEVVRVFLRAALIGRLTFLSRFCPLFQAISLEYKCFAQPNQCGK